MAVHSVSGDTLPKKSDYHTICSEVGDLGRMANLKLVDKQGKELVELKLQVLA